MKKTELLLCVMTILLFSCGRQGGSSRTQIAVSYEPQAWLLKQIIGDDMDIVTLIPAGSNPETYQPTMSTMKRLSDASVYFTLGTRGFEESTAESVSDNFSRLQVIDTSIGIDKIFGTHSGATDYGNGFDPHLTTSLRNCIKIAENMTIVLTKLYPERADIYLANCRNLTDRLTKLDKELIGRRMAGKTIIVQHPILSYFAKDYGIHQIALEIDGKEPTPVELSAKIDTIRKACPTLAVIDKSQNSILEKQVAKELSIETISVNLDSKDWIEEIKRLADEID